MYANHRVSKRWGVPDWTSAARRADEKLNRISAYVLKGAESNVDVIEELNDLAILAIIARILYEEVPIDNP
jgi:phage terminase large subunit-like protein